MISQISIDSHKSDEPNGLGEELFANYKDDLDFMEKGQTSAIQEEGHPGIDLGLDLASLQLMGKTLNQQLPLSRES